MGIAKTRLVCMLTVPVKGLSLRAQKFQSVWKTAVNIEDPDQTAHGAVWSRSSVFRLAIKYKFSWCDLFGLHPIPYSVYFDFWPAIYKEVSIAVSDWDTQGSDSPSILRLIRSHLINVYCSLTTFENVNILTGTHIQAGWNLCCLCKGLCPLLRGCCIDSKYLVYLKLSLSKHCRPWSDCPS